MEEAALLKGRVNLSSISCHDRLQLEREIPSYIPPLAMISLVNSLLRGMSGRTTTCYFWVRNGRDSAKSDVCGCGDPPHGCGRVLMSTVALE